MLDMYDFNNDIWLCHSFGGTCYNFTAFVSLFNSLQTCPFFVFLYDSMFEFMVC